MAEEKMSVMMRLSPETKERLQIAAAQETIRRRGHVSMNSLATEIITAWLDKHEDTPRKKT